MPNPTLLTQLQGNISLPAPIAGNYTIVESQLPLVGGLGGHNLLVVKDPNGNVIAELDGLATGADGSIKPIGNLSTDTLKVYETAGSYLWSADQVQATFFTGSYSQVSTLLNTAAGCGAAINNNNLPYPWMGLGSNSNSVASTLDACIGVTEPANVAKNATFTPGVGTLLLDSTTISNVQQLNGAPQTTLPSADKITGTSSSGTTQTIQVTEPDGSKQIDTVAPGADGQSSVSEQQTVSSSGTVLNDEKVTIRSDGSATVSASGNGLIASTNNAQWSVAAGSTLTVDGSNNTATLGANSAVGINGNGDIVNANGDVVSVGASSSATVNGNNNTVNGSAGDNLGVNGGGNTINAGAGERLTIGGTNGNFDTINASGDASGDTTANGQGTGIVLNASSQANVNGSGNTVTASTGDSLGVYGGGNTINAGAGELLYISNTNGNFDTINASSVVSGGTTANGQGTGIVMNFNSQVNVNGSGNTVTENTGDSLGVYGGGNTINLGAGELLVIGGTNGSFDNVYANGDVSGGTTANGQGTGIVMNANSQANVNGNGDTVTENTGDSLGIYGGGNTINAGAGELLYISNTNGNFDIVNASGDVSSGTTANGQSTGIWMNVSTQATINGSGDTIHVGNNDSLNASNDRIDMGSGQNLTLGGTSDVINASNDHITLNGSNESEIVNGGGNSFSASGSNDRFIDNLPSGGSVVDVFNGGSERSYDFTGPNGTGTMDGTSASGGGSGGYYYYYGFDRVHTRSTPTSRQAIDLIARFDKTFGNSSAASSSLSFESTLAADVAAAPLEAADTAAAPYASRFEGGTWNKHVVTWSFAAADNSKFSGAIDPAYQATVEKAFQAWADASGLKLQLVASGKADIVVGWGDLDTTQTGVLGLTSLKSHDGTIASGVQIRLEDPSQIGLQLDASGQYVYADTGATLYQTALHEVGRSLGLGANNDPNSVMNFYSTSSNLTLDATDISGIQQLYPSKATGANAIGDPAMAASVNLLIQSAASLMDSKEGLGVVRPIMTDDGMLKSLVMSQSRVDAMHRYQ